MSDKLEIGQVWQNSTNTLKIVDLTEDLEGNNCVIYVFLHDLAGGFIGVGHCSELEFVIKAGELVQNADGTPYIKPNDYQHGDVWEHIESGTAILISEAEGELKLIDPYDARPFPVAKSLLTSRPQNYRLIFRQGGQDERA